MKDWKHRKELLTDLRTMKTEELDVTEQELREQLFWQQYKRRSGQLEKPAGVKKTRRTLARCKTIQAEKDRVQTEGAKS